jgi:hypothetical protein
MAGILRVCVGVRGRGIMLMWMGWGRCVKSFFTWNYGSGIEAGRGKIEE